MLLYIDFNTWFIAIDDNYLSLYYWKKNFFINSSFFLVYTFVGRIGRYKYSKAAEWRNCTDVLTLSREEARRTNLPQSDGPLLNRAAVVKKREGEARLRYQHNPRLLCFTLPLRSTRMTKNCQLKENIVRIREIYTTIAKSLNLKMISLIGTLDEPSPTNTNNKPNIICVVVCGSRSYCSPLNFSYISKQMIFHCLLPVPSFLFSLPTSNVTAVSNWRKLVQSRPFMQNNFEHLWHTFGNIREHLRERF